MGVSAMPADGCPEYRETREYAYAPRMELCGVERRRAKRACSAATLSACVRRVAISVNSLQTFLAALFSRLTLPRKKIHHIHFTRYRCAPAFQLCAILAVKTSFQSAACLTDESGSIDSRRIIYKNIGFSFLPNGFIK